MTDTTIIATRAGSVEHVASPLIDRLEQAMMNHPAADCPLRHFFTPGLYCREITMPAGAIITSKIHMTQHQYTVSKGRCSVWIEG